MQNNLPTQQAARKFLKEFFIYNILFTGLAGGESGSGSINIQADSDFQIQKMTYFATITNANQTDATRVIPLVTTVITDQGSGRQLMNDAVAISNMFGTGEIPFILPTPKIVQARSTINVDVNNLTSGTTYDIRLSFIGTKLFPITG